MTIEVIQVPPAMALMGVKVGSFIELNEEAAQEWIANGWGKPA